MIGARDNRPAERWLKTADRMAEMKISTAMAHGAEPANDASAQRGRQQHQQRGLPGPAHGSNSHAEAHSQPKSHAGRGIPEDAHDPGRNQDCHEELERSGQGPRLRGLKIDMMFCPPYPPAG